jgi:predicted PurR-regulated permease PerM
MNFPDHRTLNALLTITAFVVVCAAIYAARSVILIFVFAIFFSYVINPVVRFLQSHSLFFRNLRGPAVVEVYLALVLVAAIIGHHFAPGALRSSMRMLDEVPGVLNGLSTGDIATEMRGKYGWSEEQEARFRTVLARHKDDIQGLVQSADRFLSNVARVLGLGLLIPILAIYFLRDGEHIVDALIRLFFWERRRPKIRALAQSLHGMLTCYIRAQLVLCGLSFLFYTAALLLLRFPHAVALGILGGVLEFIPMVGWVSTFAVISVVGIVGHQHWIWMAALLGLWRLVQDYYASPRILGSQLKLHPLAALFAVLAGAEIGGIVGVYLAVPVMAATWVIWGSGVDDPAQREEDRQVQAYEGPVRFETPVA